MNKSFFKNFIEEIFLFSYFILLICIISNTLIGINTGIYNGEDVFFNTQFAINLYYKDFNVLNLTKLTNEETIIICKETPFNDSDFFYKCIETIEKLRKK